MVVGALSRGYRRVPDHREIRGEQAKELGATCHIFRDIDVFSAFPMVAPERAASEKALKTAQFSKYMTGSTYF